MDVNILLHQLPWSRVGTPNLTFARLCKVGHCPHHSHQMRTWHSAHTLSWDRGRWPWSRAKVCPQGARGFQAWLFFWQNIIAEHEIRNISCAAQDPEDLCTFAYITKDLQTSHHYCHVFSTVDVVGRVPQLGTAGRRGLHRDGLSAVLSWHLVGS